MTTIFNQFANEETGYRIVADNKTAWVEKLQGSDANTQKQSWQKCHHTVDKKTLFEHVEECQQYINKQLANEPAKVLSFGRIDFHNDSGFIDIQLKFAIDANSNHVFYVSKEGNKNGSVISSNINFNHEMIVPIALHNLFMDFIEPDDTNAVMQFKAVSKSFHEAINSFDKQT